jgi:hypothetical protein
MEHSLWRITEEAIFEQLIEIYDFFSFFLFLCGGVYNQTAT